MKIQLGSGWHHMAGYVNVDKYTPHRVYGFDVQADAEEYMRTVPAGAATEIISRHLIEHLHRERAERMLINCARALASGGKLIVECPDLYVACKRFVDSEGRDHPNGIYGAHRGPGDTHFWGYSPHTLNALVEKVGLTVTHLGPGTDRHACKEQPCIRIEAVKP